MDDIKLFMLLLGCTPKGRHIEQHDVYFATGRNLRELVPGIIEYWPEAQAKIHIDAWREVTAVNGFSVTLTPKTGSTPAEHEAQTAPRLFFINLGGYKQNEFEEYHYKMLAIANNKGEAIRQAKQTAFYKHTGFKTAESHIDDKYGIDVDDIYAIEDIMPEAVKKQYSIVISPAPGLAEDEMHLGYFVLSKL